MADAKAPPTLVSVKSTIGKLTRSRKREAGGGARRASERRDRTTALSLLLGRRRQRKKKKKRPAEMEGCEKDRFSIPKFTSAHTSLKLPSNNLFAHFRGRKRRQGSDRRQEDPR